MSLDNMWITNNREEQKKKRSYAEVTHNREEVKLSDSGEEKTWSNQQRVNILENHRGGNVNFSDIYQDLWRDEKSNSSRIVTLPKIFVNASSRCNNSNQAKSINTSAVLDYQDQDILKILEELQSTGEDGTTFHNNISSNCVYESRIEGHFCSDTVFNLSRRFLAEKEIKVLGKGLNFAPIQNKINKPELRTDFNEFCRRMRIKWYFKDEPMKEFSNIPAFSSKSTWMPINGHPNLEVYLNQIENEVFKISREQFEYSNLSKLEWEAIRLLAGDRSIVVKKVDKGSCVVVWD